MIKTKANERKNMNNSGKSIANGEQSTWSYGQRKYYREAPVAFRDLIAKHFNS